VSELYQLTYDHHDAPVSPETIHFVDPRLSVGCQSSGGWVLFLYHDRK